MQGATVRQLCGSGLRALCQGARASPQPLCAAEASRGRSQPPRASRQARALHATAAPMSYKKNVSASSPVFKEFASFGGLYTVKDLPLQLDKTKPAVYEIRSEISPHLLKAAAESLALAGCRPGLFTRNAETGKPLNIRFTDAQQDFRKLQDLWLMVFVPVELQAEFKENLKTYLSRAVALHQVDLSGDDGTLASIDMQHAGTQPDCQFSEDGPAEIGIVYEVGCSFADLLFTVATMLSRKGAQASVLTSDPEGRPMAPKMIVTIPAREEQLLQDFPAMLHGVTGTALKKYKEHLASQVKEFLRDGETLEPATTAA